VKGEWVQSKRRLLLPHFYWPIDGDKITDGDSLNMLCSVRSIVCTRRSLVHSTGYEVFSARGKFVRERGPVFGLAPFLFYGLQHHRRTE